MIALRIVAALVLAVATTYVVAAYTLRFAMLIAGWVELRHQLRYRLLEDAPSASTSRELPAITIVVPAYNEETSICRTVRSLLSQRYPDFEIVVINDGSVDRTLGVLDDEFELEPDVFFAGEDIPTQNVRMAFRSRRDKRVRVIDKRNGGKADALNVGINHSTGTLVCVIDADVILDRWALFHLVLPFLEDATTVASSGTIRPHNGCTIADDAVTSISVPHRLVEGLQVVEYLLAFGVGRLFFNSINGHVVISGAFGLFRRDLLVEISGFHPQAIGEDMELVVRIHQHLRQHGTPYRITFVADALCYTEAPSSITELGKQRTRWHQGLLTTLRLHRGMIWRRRYGAAGAFALPYFLLFELIAPAVEAVGWLTVIGGMLFRIVNPASALEFVGAVMFLSTVNAWSGILVDDAFAGHYRRVSDIARLCAYAAAEHFWYHQMMIYYRLRAFARFYGGIHIKGGWVSPTRRNAAAAGRPSDGGQQARG